MVNEESDNVSRIDGTRVESQNLDPSDVLFLHHSDHPNYTLSTQLLNDHKYYHWKRSVEVSLIAKNKMSFVNGKCPKPDLALSTYAQWERCNSMVISWLLQSVEKDIAETLLYWNTAAELWEDLRMRFSFQNCTRVFQVQKELFNLTQENLALTSYFTKFKRLWDEYMALVEMPSCSTCGTVGYVPQLLYNLQIIQFLVGLNDSYTMVRGNILMLRPMPNIE